MCGTGTQCAPTINSSLYIDFLHISAGAMAEWATSSLVTTGWSHMLAAEGEIDPAGPNLLPVPNGL